jgi:RNA polymerase-interacting CarD/CdnL/TRCF family regulator
VSREEIHLPFNIGDQVVYPAFGVGRVVALVSKSFFEAESHVYYEVIGDRSTVWVQVDESAARGLRRLTRPDELAHYRGVVGGRPDVLNQDHRQRQLDLRGQFKLRTMQSLCEMMRNLSARSWTKTLNEMDSHSLRLSQEAICEEWAATEAIPLPQAAAEVAALLLAGRNKYQSIEVTNTSRN